MYLWPVMCSYYNWTAYTCKKVTKTNKLVCVTLESFIEFLLLIGVYYGVCKLEEFQKNEYAQIDPYHLWNHFFFYYYFNYVCLCWSISIFCCLSGFTLLVYCLLLRFLLCWEEECGEKTRGDVREDGGLLFGFWNDWRVIERLILVQHVVHWNGSLVS